METKEAIKNEQFRDFIEALPVKEYANVRKQIITKCKITDQVFRHWRNGNTAVPELAKPIINKIAGYKVFETNTNN